MLNKFRLIPIALLLFACATVSADVIPLFPPANGGNPDPHGTGFIVANNNPAGPDAMRIDTTGLAPNTVYSVFLGESPQTGALPVDFIGVFTTDGSGVGRFEVTTEIFNAFGVHNSSVDADGIQVNGLPGAKVNGGRNNASLDFIRIYRAMGGQTVFASAAGANGGGHVLSSTRSFEGMSICDLPLNEIPPGFCDGVVPPSPTPLQAAGMMPTNCDVAVSWAAAPGTAFYRLTRVSLLHFFPTNTVIRDVQGTTFQDLNLDEGSHTYSVQACNNSGNCSAPSNSDTAATGSFQANGEFCGFVNGQRVFQD